MDTSNRGELFEKTDGINSIWNLYMKPEVRIFTMSKSFTIFNDFNVQKSDNAVSTFL